MGEREIIEERNRKLKELLEMGIEPYGRAFSRIPINEVKEGEENVSVAGRIIAIRKHGRASFADIVDWSGKIQVYFKEDILQDGYKIFKKLDIGDIIGIKGDVFRTKTGELTILVKEFKILSKSLRPLPEKWHGLRDVEIRFRKRYVDLLVNKDVREIFKKRIRIIQLIREFLDKKGFLEVETPMMHPIPGGATAKPFITYHNSLDMELYLRVSPELYLKRLLVGGFEKVYEINRCFRNEGISTLHNPEFTMLELYQAYADYRKMMEITEELFVYICENLNGSLKISYQGKEIDFSRPWKVMELKEIYKSIGIEDWKDIGAVRKKIKEMKLEIEKEEEKDVFELLEAIFKKKIQPELISPTFVIGYPKETSPLAKNFPGNEEIVERFELFIGGLEIANAYSELNDPIEQKNRFIEEVKLQKEDRPKTVDTDYIEALEYGMPPAGGLGIGIDRMTMLFTDTPSIREVILFPILRVRK
ncbi:MAG TPA: lysine--tRNA ligase [bacterium]|nr:lysine--tRNA ligase [bacterium]